MSSERPRHESVATYLEVFGEEIRRCQRRALPGDWNKLARRLGALSQRVRQADRASTQAPDWAYRLEHKVITGGLPGVLLPEVLADVVKELHEQLALGEAETGVWAPLEPATFEEDMRGLRARECVAEAAVLTALERNARKASSVRLSEGVRALEDLYEARVGMAPLFDADLLVAEGERLVRALKLVLPPSAREVIGDRVEALFRSELEGKPIDELEPARSHWHHCIGLGVWHPVWSKLWAFSYEKDLVGTFFFPELQGVYEELRAAAEAERAQQSEAEEERERVAAAAQQEVEPREPDSGADEVDRRRGQEEERKRRAEAKALKEQARRQKEEARRQKEEARRQEERHRAAELAREQARREEERHRAEELAREQAELELRQEKHSRRERERTHREHRLHIPRVQSKENRARVLRYRKRHGIEPRDLTPKVREVFRREFRV